MEIPDKFGIGIFVNLIDDCNNNCRFCIFEKSRGDFRSGREMDCGAFMKMLESATRNPPQFPLFSINFAGSGEPLLYPKIKEVVRAAAKTVPYTTLVTNGILLDAEMAKSFLEAPLSHIVISITGFTPETYCRYQGSGKPREQAEQQFFAVRRNIEELIKMRDCLGSPTQIGISYILHDDTKAEFFKALDYWHKAGAEYVDARILSLGYVLSVKDYDEYLEQVACELNGVACTCFGKVMNLSTDGKLHFCNCSYQDETLLGNVFETPLDEILRSDKFHRSFRAFHGDYGAIPECCKTCDLGRARPVLA